MLYVSQLPPAERCAVNSGSNQPLNNLRLTFHSHNTGKEQVVVLDDYKQVPIRSVERQGVPAQGGVLEWTCSIAYLWISL